MTINRPSPLFINKQARALLEKHINSKMRVFSEIRQLDRFFAPENPHIAKLIEILRCVSKIPEIFKYTRMAHLKDTSYRYKMVLQIF